jgi:hypothetical protein
MAELDARAKQWEQDLEWAKEQVALYAARLPDYECFAKVLREVLLCAAAEYAPLAIVQARAKTTPRRSCASETSTGTRSVN